MSTSILPPIAPFSFSCPPGNALRKNKSVQSCITCRKRKTKCDRQWPCTPCKNRGEADTCEPYVKESSNRPTGYTHVSDTSILANRVAQLEQMVSLLITRVDSVEPYHDLAHNFKDPLPVFRPAGRDGDDTEQPDQGQGRLSKAQNDRDASEDGGTGQTRDRSESVSKQQRDVSLPHVTSATVPTNSSTSDALGTLLPPDHMSSAHILASIAAGATPQPPDASKQPELHDVHSHSEYDQPMDMAIDYSMDPLPDWARLAPQNVVPQAAGPSGFGLGSSVYHQLGHSSEPISKPASVREHHATLELEGIALGRNVEQHDKQTERDDDDDTGLPTFSSLVHRSAPVDTALYDFPEAVKLPNLLIGKYVLAYYLDNLHFHWRCLHRPTMERQTAQLFTRLRSKATRFTHSELSVLSLYAACLAVGFLHLDDDAATDIGIDLQEARDLATTCWRVAYRALDESDWMQSHDIRGCQTVIISGLYLSSVRRAGQHWAMLGAATKVAMAMGLASIPDEGKIIAKGSLEHVAPRWRSAIDREVGRRVWFCLVEYDMLFSMEHGFLYIISPETYQTTEPANINDPDIRDDKPVVSQPLEVYTEMSHSLARLQLIYPLRELVLATRKEGRMRYAFVTKANNTIQQCIDSRPTFFKASEGHSVAQDAEQLTRIKLEGCILKEATDLRLVRIHRSYFPASCHNSRYLLTKQTCLAAVPRMLDAARNYAAQEVGTYPHSWARNYLVFTATVIAIIYLTSAPPEELETIKAQAEDGIAQLKAVPATGRLDLGDTADTLRTLMNNQLARRESALSPRGLKRSFNDFVFEQWGGLWTEGEHLGSSAAVAGPDTGDTAAGSADAHDLGSVFDSLLTDYAFL